MSKVKDETGKKYGELTVIKREGSINNLAAWKCICNCGNYIRVTGSSLRSGNTKSCGCQQYRGFNEQRKIQNQSSIRIGDKFGKLTIIKELDLRLHGTQGHKRRWYLCQCDCGNTCEAMGNMLKNGQKNSCGCLISKGELYICKLLDENNINYKKEVIDERLFHETGRRLRFDFAIYNNKNELQRYIEFDGQQHNNKMQGGVWSQSDNLEERQLRDKIKNDFCLKHNIHLLRIPYYMKDNITIDLLLGKKGGE